MKMRKFGSKAKANKFAKAMHLKAVRVKAAKMADGTKGALYKFRKRAKKAKPRKRRR